MTIQDAVNWLNSQVGQHEDFDGVYGTQCVDFFNFYYRYLTGRNFLQEFGGLPGAKDVWGVNAPGFTRIVNNPADPNQLPPQGAILFWGGNMPGSGGYGHVAVVDRADATHIVVWEEVPGSNVQHITRTWSSPAQHWELGWWVFAGFVASAPAPPPDPAPVAAPKPPAAPLAVPNSLDPYKVVKQIDGYLTSNQAANHLGKGTPVPENTYTIYNKRYDVNGKLIAINVTLKPGSPGWWINPADNVITPLPVAPTTGFVGPREASPAAAPATPAPAPDWRSTYRAFVDKSGQRKPVMYQAFANCVVKDLANGHPDVALHIGDLVMIGGTFEKDGVVYGRPEDAIYDREGNYRGWYYGIVLDGGVIEPYAKLYNPQTTVAERQVLHESTIYDYLFVIIPEGIHKFLSPLFDLFANKDQKK